MSDNTAALSAIQRLLYTARQSQQRRLLVLSGEQYRNGDLLASLFQQECFQRSILVTNNQAEAADAYRLDSLFDLTFTIKQARQLLGQELDLLVYDAWSGLDPDALAAVTGALCGGGLLILMVPQLQRWPQYDDPDYQRLLVHPFQADQISGRFLTHIQRSICEAKRALVIEPAKITTTESDEELLDRELIDTHNNSVSGRGGSRGDHCLSDDQAQAVAAIIRVASGHRRRPLVMTSDRGRGKSSALGIAGAQLMKQGIGPIIITAPRLESVRPVFDHATRLLGIECEASSGRSVDAVHYEKASLKFVAADELLRHHYKAALLLVDEAAAIPAAMLEQFAKRYSRLVFSTTTHGYEGSGRGFDLRFKGALNTIAPQWRAIQLQQPVRWAIDDPVERWLYDALLLDAEAADAQNCEQAITQQCITQVVDRDQLLADKQLLKQLFGLLVQAHYQTTPSDLRNLLDGPNISVWLTRFQGHVVAAALVAKEGGFDPGLSMSVWQGKRRPRGHLLPQTLSAHAGLQQAPELTYWRIMRIAVHPVAQQRGLGKQLSHAIIQQARLQQCDFVGSSFAATADVLSFWRSLHCVPVRMGVSRDVCSGCFSAIVLCSLSHRGELLLETAKQRFNEQFPRELAHGYRDLEPALVAELLLGAVTEPCAALQVLNPQDWLDIEAFVAGYRQYDTCFLPLWKLVCIAFSQASIRQQLTSSQQALLIMRVLQYQPIDSVAEYFGLTGKKQVLATMREAIKRAQLAAKLLLDQQGGSPS